MDRARYRGLNPLQEQLYLIASIQNLKRLVSFMRRRKTAVQAQIHEKVSPGILLPPFLSWVNRCINTLSYCIHKKVAYLMAIKKYLLFYGALSS